MDNFVVSARKYRPSRFDEVIGQEQVTTTLKNEVSSNKLAQSFLFTGPRGVGKTTCARILAKLINCLNPTQQIEPCNECESCLAFNQSNSFNIHELDAASNNSVDDIRNLVDQVRYPPQAGKYKIYIIDEVHMLSQSAFNAFLKTLEEPPPYAIFILATTEKHKIIPTILSRCQIFDFSRIKQEEMVSHLTEIASKEGITCDADALHLIAQKSDGALRDALSIFDRMVSFGGGQVKLDDVLSNLDILDYNYYFKLTEHFLTQDVANVLLLFEQILQAGFEGDNFMNGLAEHYRDLLVCKDPQTLNLLTVSDSLKERYQQQAAITPASYLINALAVANRCDMDYKMARNKKLHVEMALIRMAYLGTLEEGVDKAQIVQPDVKPEAMTLPVSEEPASAPEPSPAPSPAVQELPASEPVAEQLSEPAPQPEPAPVPEPVAEQPTEPTTEPVAEQPAAPAPEPVAEQPAPAEAPVAEEAPSPAEPTPAPAPEPTQTPPQNSGMAFSLDAVDDAVDNTQEEAATEEQEEEAEDEGPVDADAMRNIWKAFSERMKDGGKMSIWSLMTSVEPEAEGGVVVIKVENPLMENQMNTIRTELAAHLASELGRKKVALQISVERTDDGDSRTRKPYTAEEKFQKMAEKNPAIKDMREKLDLELEF